MESRSDWSLYKRSMRFARPYALHIFGLALLGLLATPIALLVPVPLKIAVDNVIGADPLNSPISWIVPPFARAGDTALLAWAAALIVAVAIVRDLQQLGQSLLRTWIGERLLLDFRARLFRHSQRLSLLYHDSTGSSDSIYRIQYDAYAVRTIALDGFIPFLTSGVTLVGMIWVVLRLDWQLALVAMAISPILLMLTTTYRRRLRPRWKKVKRLESSGLSVIQEVITSLRVVKSFNQEDREQERFEQRYREGFLARMRVLIEESGFGFLVGLTTATGTGIILWLGVRHVLEGVLTLGSLLLIMGYLSQLYGPLKTMGKQVTKLQSALASGERAFGLLDRDPDVEEREDALPIERARGEIRFDSVSFSYERHPVLRDVSFDVRSGERIGIAGPTGVGKTTLVSLLTRLFDPDEGRVLLDGRDLREYRLGDLRNQYAIVLQETMLFSTTIAENIAYGRPAASLEEIRAAARAANIDAFVQSLPDGYDTLVGERGMGLSGGERQRVALARAYLKDAPILILDEPTSSVDLATEAAILDSMERLMEGRTTFMIAHRLSTLEGCDRLLVLDEKGVTMSEQVGETLDAVAADHV